MNLGYEKRDVPRIPCRMYFPIERGPRNPPTKSEYDRTFSNEVIAYMLGIDTCEDIEIHLWSEQGRTNQYPPHRYLLRFLG